MRKCISLVIPLYNEAENIKHISDRLCLVINALPYNFEIICINDGSKDDTLRQLILLHTKDPRFKVVNFSRNFGKEAALTAGIDLASGEALIPLDADLQDPPECIPSLIQKWEEGFDIVNARREIRVGERFFKKWSAHLFYRSINKLSDIKISEDVGDFRLLSRNVIDIIKKLPERRRFMKGLFSWVGFKTAEITYKRAPRYAGKTNWNYWQLWNFALEGITSFSQLPLKLSTYVGFLVAFLSFIYGLYMVIKTLVCGNPVPGYPSLIVIMLFVGGIELMALGIMGEYIGRIYDEVKQRPIYVVRDKWW